MLLREQNGFLGAEDYRPRVYGLDVEHHGGECCGVKHLHNFPCCEYHTISAAEKEKWLRDGIERAIESFSDFEDSERGCDEWRGCIEVILAENQLNGWCRTLEEAGFSQVYSFLNHNSGNECHVFLLETNRPK